MENYLHQNGQHLPSVLRILRIEILMILLSEKYSLGTLAVDEVHATHLPRNFPRPNIPFNSLGSGPGNMTDNLSNMKHHRIWDRG